MTEEIIFAVIFVLALIGAFVGSKLYHSRPRPFRYGDESFLLVADPGRNILEGLYDNCGFQYADGTPVTDEREIRRCGNIAADI